MALTTTADLGLLTIWGWLRAYHRNRSEFIEIAKIVFRTMNAMSGNPPQLPIDVEPMLADALLCTTLFKKLCVVRRRSFADSRLYPDFALALSRYILDNDWAAIIQP
jgi:hypothetical protein